MYNNLELKLRKLAKRIDNLNLFTAAKEINNIRLFKNEMDLSLIQKNYLSYLYFYYNLTMDIMRKEVSEKVLDNEIFEDAYDYWKSNKKQKKDKRNKSKDCYIVFDKPGKEVK
jgi:hypothetical protein